jgi:hypothetical protein
LPCQYTFSTVLKFFHEFLNIRDDDRGAAVVPLVAEDELEDKVRRRQTSCTES